MTLIIGIGNDFRKDDAAGLLVAQRLKDKVGKDVQILEQNGDGATLMESWQGRDKVILIDAVQSGGSPGAIHRFEADKAPLPEKFLRCSTHQLGVMDAIELARAMNRLPRRLIVCGIEGKYFDVGNGLSTEVERAIPEVLERVLSEIALEKD